MLTRRQTVLGLVAATFGGGVLTTGTFSTSTTAGADFRLMVVSELSLTSERDDGAYVEVDGAGQVTGIALDGLNGAAISRFEDLVRITNDLEVTVDELDFEFRVTDEDTDERVRDAEESLGIVYDGTNIHEGGGVATILDDSGEELAPGEFEVFGVEVDLRDQATLLDSGLEIRLLLTAKQEEEP